MDRYTIKVSTRIYYSDGTLFADLGTFIWPNVSENMRSWLAGSCHKAAMWLAVRKEYRPGYKIIYRTIVTKDDKLISDTGDAETEYLSYEDVVGFELLALEELKEMIGLFVKEHTNEVISPKKRSIIMQYVKWAWTAIKTK